MLGGLGVMIMKALLYKGPQYHRHQLIDSLYNTVFALTLFQRAAFQPVPRESFINPPGL